MVTVKINGKEVTVEDGTLILDAAREAGYEIPTFCYQADLLGVGSCRMCLVEIEGQKKLQPSCVTPVIHDMNIQTATSAVQNARSAMLEFLLSNHALDCPVCDKGGECELQDMVYDYGPHKGRHAEPKYRFHEKDYQLSPVIIKNSNRCVQCMKCVRVCREVVGANVLGGMNRGHHQEETSFMRSFLDCDQCGNCIEVCPVGCFMRVPYRYKTRPWDLTGADSVCPYCATGCRMKVEERDGTVIRSRAQLGVGINSETLCARGRFGYDFVHSEERVTAPMIRKHGGHEDVSWDDALAEIKGNIRSSMGRSAAGVAGPRLTNEELYLFGRLMRDVLGTPNVDSTSRWDPAGVEAFIEAAGMNGGGVSTFDCVEADTVMVVGSHISDENPITDYTIRRYSHVRPMNLVVASPRAMKLDSSANLTVRHNPAAEGALLTAASLALKARYPEKLSSVEALKDARGDASAFASEAGVSSEEVEDLVARLGRSETVSVMAGTEFLRYPHSSKGLKTFREVLKALGKEVRVLPLLDRSNQRGAWEMGVHPHFGPGYSSFTERGLGTDGILEAAARGEIDFLYLAGVDPVSMHPDEEFVRDALTRVRFLVVQDMQLTEAGKLAHVFLPAAGASEKDGTVTNQEGRVQAITGLLPPQGKARTDLSIIRSVGRLMDSTFGGATKSILDDIRSEVAMYRNVDLKFNNLRNKANNLDIREALVAPTDRDFSPIGTIPAKAGEEAGDPRRPFTLTTGNHLFHSGMFSRSSDTLNSITKGSMVEISEEDARDLGLNDNDTVRVTGEKAEALVKLKVVKGSKRGVAFMAENYDDAPVNRFYTRGGGLPRVGITRA